MTTRVPAQDYARLVHTLDDGGVDFILIGGLAANVHGSPRYTQDVDVVYDRHQDNVARIVKCLAPLKPYLRGAPPGLPFEWSSATLAHGLNFTLTTTAGSLDILGEIVGGGRYADLLPHTARAKIFGRDVRVLNLDALIRAKRAAGRPKDFEAIAELELLTDPEIIAAAEAGKAKPRKK